MKNIPINLKQLFFLSLCGFGIQFASSLQMTNTSSLYNFLGADSANISYLWLAAPIAGLIVQPIVGQFSDSTVTQYGKRIPYIFIWGILSFITLLLLTFASQLWIAAAVIWILSCSINGCTEALRALIGDIVPNQQKALAFSWQTIFSGIGAGIAALLPSILKEFPSLTAMYSATQIPKTLQASFIIGAIILSVTILITCLKIKEKTFTKKQLLEIKHLHAKKSTWQKINLAFREIIFNIKHMPNVIKEFSYVQLFSWTGIFCMWLYFGIGIAQHLFGLPTGTPIENNPEYANILERGTIFTGVCFSIYQFVSVIYALILPSLAKKLSARMIHCYSLMIGALSLISIGFLYNQKAIYLCMVGIGIMWGSVMTMPYVIISSEVPRSKMGVYLGIFNITITVPQILSGLFLGFITANLFHYHAIYSIILGGVLILISSIIMLLYNHNIKLCQYIYNYVRHPIRSLN